MRRLLGCGLFLLASAAWGADSSVPLLSVTPAQAGR